MSLTFNPLPSGEGKRTRRENRNGLVVRGMASKADFTKVKVFVPGGQLGAGVRGGEVDAAVERGMDVMAMDAGSTDSGAAYLASGTSKNSREAVKADLVLLMAAQQKTG